MHLFRSSLSSLVILATLILVTGCGTPITVTSTPGTATATKIIVPTGTTAPSCTTVLAGATALSPVPNFSDVKIPTGAVAQSPTNLGGGAGQFQVSDFSICFTGIVDDVTGPFSGHTSVVAYLFGSGWGVSTTFPNDGAVQSACAANCYSYPTSGSHPYPRYIALDNVTTTGSGGSGLVTYHMRLALPPSTPACAPATDYPMPYTYSIYFDTTAGINHFQLPSLTVPSSNKGGGTAGSTYISFCSAGTTSSIVAFMQIAVTTSGWTVSSVTATGFFAQQVSGGRTYSFTVDASNPDNWFIRMFRPM